jgi:nucleoid-associated protein YgaU
MDQQRFESLKQKYSAVLSTIQQQRIRLEHLHEESGKLTIACKAPSNEAKNKVWDKIKQIDSAYPDVDVDITVDSSLASAEDEQTYTVEAGDTLSKISKQFYGEASLYMNIFEANRDKLTDPNQIQPGMELRIPLSDKQVAS